MNRAGRMGPSRKAFMEKLLMFNVAVKRTLKTYRKENHQQPDDYWL